MKAIPTKAVDQEIGRFDRVFECLMWSDPRDNMSGTEFNSARQCAVRWGPDVTRRFLEFNDLELIIRSHEVVDKGFNVRARSHCLHAGMYAVGCFVS